MSFERDFLSMMPDTITVSTVATLGVGGAATFSTASTSFRCRVVPKNLFVHDSRGQGAAVAYEVWVASTSAKLAPSSKYTLPDGSTPPVVTVDRFPDQQGGHHVRLRLGR